ncbi:hypothetical protein [Amantichitinum ursilacus]|uniref:Uncharacterized protein n=1 Tax=Amantichitinum ursilacus TaxID=857265 RepID=A0A0N0GM74_9NEIS|nr:hypothetical protein [Amantichitinum ursilacus]KPC50687.1 hypothetical protein WG78_16575 [Amantichitinum ursilacus]
MTAKPCRLLRLLLTLVLLFMMCASCVDLLGWNDAPAHPVWFYQGRSALAFYVENILLLAVCSCAYVALWRRQRPGLRFAWAMPLLVYLAWAQWNA